MEKNNLKLEIKAILENVAVVRVTISSFISNLNVTIDELMDIKTAVSEAVTNVVEHAYCENTNDDKKVYIEAYIYEDVYDKVVIKIKDSGIGIEDIELATTPEYTSKPELEHAGMGFTIMQTFMDEIVIDSSVNEGTIITLTKEIRKIKSK
jgi:stage II sporulation protein AB (anti-sigma F factor)